MKRYTTTRLWADVEDINQNLAGDGCTTRLEVGGRNGYQAIDEYSVDAAGDRIGSGVNRNVCCGTSRECYDAAKLYYYQAVATILRNSVQA